MRVMNVEYDFMAEDYKPPDTSAVDREVLELARVMYVNKIKRIELIVGEGKKNENNEQK